MYIAIASFPFWKAWLHYSEQRRSYACSLVQIMYFLLCFIYLLYVPPQGFYFFQDICRAEKTSGQKLVQYPALWNWLLPSELYILNNDKWNYSSNCPSLGSISYLKYEACLLNNICQKCFLRHIFQNCILFLSSARSDSARFVLETGRITRTSKCLIGNRKASGEMKDELPAAAKRIYTSRVPYKPYKAIKEGKQHYEGSQQP